MPVNTSLRQPLDGDCDSEEDADLNETDEPGDNELDPLVFDDPPGPTGTIRDLFMADMSLYESHSAPSKPSVEDLENDPTIGPTNIPVGSTSPLDFFRLFFDSAMMGEFVSATNSYGQKKYPSAWKKVDEGSIMKLLAVIGIFGVIRQPTLSSYWSGNDIYRRDWVKRQFSRDSFAMIWSSLHAVGTLSLRDSTQP